METSLALNVILIVATSTWIHKQQQYGSLDLQYKKTGHKTPRLASITCSAQEHHFFKLDDCIRFFKKSLVTSFNALHNSNHAPSQETRKGKGSGANVLLFWGP